MTIFVSRTLSELFGLPVWVTPLTVKAGVVWGKDIIP